MNILHIEDNIEWSERSIAGPLRKKGHNVTVVPTRDKAISILDENSFDYIILDLAIPVNEIDASPDVDHGVNLASFIRENYPGTPILILSGQNTERVAEELEDDYEFAIFWDGANKRLVKRKNKSNADEAIAIILDAGLLLSNLDQIEIETEDALTSVQCRILRIFAKHRNATSLTVNKIQGGLSGSSVFGVELKDFNKNVLLSALVKIGIYPKIDKDINNCWETNRLPIGAAPNFINEYSAGCGEVKGAVFQLANTFNRNLFQILERSDHDASTVINRLISLLQPWHDQAEPRTSSIRDIRRILCGDDDLNPDMDINGLDQFENNEITSWFSTQHSDLHGENILVSDDLRPVLIDFGDIKVNPKTLDPITISLSPFFHPSTSDTFSLTTDMVEKWFDVQIQDICGFPESMSVIRTWVNANAYGRREIFAVTYAYCCRQLKYDSPNRESAKEFIRSIIRNYQ